MNLGPLFEQQRKTMEMYEQKHPTEQGENRSIKRILALLVEIGELANETRCFKFWSNKGPSEKEITLEEFVDGVHFMLELGIENNFDLEEFPFLHEGNFELYTEKDVTLQFVQTFSAVCKFSRSKTLESYEDMFLYYIGLSKHLNFTWEEIEQAYWRKNRINYERQENGY